LKVAPNTGAAQFGKVVCTSRGLRLVASWQHKPGGEQ
jgi:hypothetical protein